MAVLVRFSSCSVRGGWLRHPMTQGIRISLKRQLAAAGTTTEKSWTRWSAVCSSRVCSCSINRRRHGGIEATKLAAGRGRKVPQRCSEVDRTKESSRQSSRRRGTWPCSDEGWMLLLVYRRHVLMLQCPNSLFLRLTDPGSMVTYRRNRAAVWICVAGLATAGRACRGGCSRPRSRDAAPG